MAIRRRTVGLIGGVGLVLLVGAAAAALWFGGFFDVDEGRAAAPTAPGLEQPEADHLATGLMALEPEQVAEVLSEDAAAAYLAAPAPVVPPGSTLTIDASTFTATGEVDAVVGGTLSTGAEATEIVLLLALEDGQWRVLTSRTA